MRLLLLIPSFCLIASGLILMSRSEGTPAPTLPDEGDAIATKPITEIQTASFDYPPPLTSEHAKPLPIEELPEPRESRQRPVRIEARIPRFPIPVVANRSNWPKELPTADDMERLLRRVPELQFVSDQEGRFHLKDRAATRDKELVTVRDEIVNHPLMAGLPWQQGGACRVDESRIRDFVHISQSIRACYALAAVRRGSNAKAESIEKTTERLLSQYRLWNSPTGARLLKQKLQGENRLDRLALVEFLGQISAKEAAAGLAQLAIFDVDEGVRSRAVERLRQRRIDDWQSALLAGFRHHWEPAAVNAAHALIALESIDALPALIRLLDEPDPNAPFLKPDTGNQLQVRELVRFNHNHNCAICHPATKLDSPLLLDSPLIAEAPSPNQPLASAFDRTYQGRTPEIESLAIRFDVTFLRQDFSARLPYELYDQWPREQRYDFVTRIRPATAEEADAAKSRRPSYPQRDAVLHVLRTLTGKDGGDSAGEWEQILLGLPR